MSARTHRPLRPSRSTPELSTLAVQIDDAFSDLTADEPAHLLRVVTRTATDEGVELGLLPLEPGQHPADVMAGFTAPPNWHAVGVVTTGRSREIQAGKEPPVANSEPRPIRLTFLLDRLGDAITLVTPLGSAADARRELHEPPDGMLADACRRVLRLATAPPSDSPDLWLTMRWLDQLLAAAAAEPGAVTTWSAAVALHPLAPPGSSPSPVALAELVDQAVLTFDWERLRLLAAGGTGPAPALEPAVAAWMDAGSFARHLLGAELPVDLMLTELDALLPAAVMRAVRRALPSSGGARP